MARARRRASVPSRQSQPKLAPRPAAGCHRVVDLLALALAHVADQQIAGHAGRTKSATGCAARRPRSASPRTGCPPGSCTGPTPEARGSIRRILPSSDSRFCALPGGSSAAAAVAGADVEHPVGPELQLAAVVVEEGRVRDRQHRPAARHRHRAAVGRELVDLQRPVRRCGCRRRRGDGVRRVVGREGDREQPALAAGSSPGSACRGRGRCWRRRGRRAGSSRAARPPAPGRGRRAASSRRPGR